MIIISGALLSLSRVTPDENDYHLAVLASEKDNSTPEDAFRLKIGLENWTHFFSFSFHTRLEAISSIAFDSST
jgi:hypothetical protein